MELSCVHLHKAISFLSLTTKYPPNTSECVSAKRTDLSIPNVSFVLFDFVLLEKIAVFILKTSSLVMPLLS